MNTLVRGEFVKLITLELIFYLSLRHLRLCIEVIDRIFKYPGLVYITINSACIAPASFRASSIATRSPGAAPTLFTASTI